MEDVIQKLIYANGGPFESDEEIVMILVDALKKICKNVESLCSNESDILEQTKQANMKIHYTLLDFKKKLENTKKILSFSSFNT